MRWMLLAAALASVAACDNKAAQQRQDDWEAIHHAAVLFRHAQRTCHATDADLQQLRTWIDTEVRRNGDFAEAAAKGVDEADAQFAESQRSGTLEHLRSAACPSAFALLKKMNSAGRR